MSALGNIVNKTNDVYLYTLAPAANGFELRGQSGSVDSMASFLSFLKNSGTFEHVQLEQFYQDDIKERLSYKFSLSCQFKSPSGGTSPTSGSAPEAPPGPAAPGGPAGPVTEPSNKPGGTATPARAPGQHSL
jgi:Tfp pilus assembly protein PilN